MTISDSSRSGFQNKARTRARSSEHLPPLGDTPKQRPALQKLKQDQDAIVADLREGFANRAEVLEWFVKANIRTLGLLSPEFYKERFNTPIELRWLAPQGDGSTARSFRHDLAITVDEAADRAYRMLRESVTEYTDEKTPTVQLNGGSVAFRPALTEYEQRQLSTLFDGRGGFESRQRLDAWERDMQDASFGEYSEMPDYQLSQNRCSWGYEEMLASPGEALLSRDKFLVMSIFPAFIRGVRQLWKQADEQVDDTGSGSESLKA